MSDTQPAWKRRLLKDLYRIVDCKDMPGEAGLFLLFCATVLVDVDEAKIPELHRAVSGAVKPFTEGAR